MTLSEKPLPGAERIHPVWRERPGAGETISVPPSATRPWEGKPPQVPVASSVTEGVRSPWLPRALQPRCTTKLEGVGDTAPSDCNSHCGGTRTRSWVAAVPWFAGREKVKTWVLHERAWTQTCPCASAPASGGAVLSEPGTGAPALG